MAILLAVDHWRAYLQQAKFIIKTDQKSLTHLDDQRLTTPWQHKALTKLTGLSFKLVYKQGKENIAVDALSRISHADIHGLVAISVCEPTWLEELQTLYQQDPRSTQPLQEFAVHSPSGHFTLQDGIIYYKSKIWVGTVSSIQNKILQALHSSPVGGHSGIEATYSRIKKLFAWPHLKQSVKDFVSQCSICQQAKAERVAYPGFLAPLPIPAGAWQTVSLDFIEGLPRSATYNCILVVIDKISKYAHFVLLSHPFTSFQIALV
jgi:hypothetical protein